MKALRLTLLAATIGLFLAAPALADPVQVGTDLYPLVQDNWQLNGWVEELSTSSWDLQQRIYSQEVTWQGHIPCPAEYLGGGGVQVLIVNMTSRYFTDLYYVGDVNPYIGVPQTIFTNWDEMVADLSTGPPYAGLAFKIDAVGLNTPLVYESMSPDQVFEPGEAWQFVIQDYFSIPGLGPALLGSVGAQPLGAIAAASGPGMASSGSIITPEPGTMALLALGGLGLVARLRRRRRGGSR